MLEVEAIERMNANRAEMALKRKFWRRFLWSGVLFLAVVFIWMFLRYQLLMGQVGDSAVGKPSDAELEVLTYSQRRVVIYGLMKWMIPLSILASVWINVARYRLRKLRKQEREVERMAGI